AEFAGLHHKPVEQLWQCDDSRKVHHRKEHSAKDDGPEMRAKEIDGEEHGCCRRQAKHDPQHGQSHVGRRIAGSINHAQRRIHQIVPVKIKTPAQRNRQHKKKRGYMLSDIPADDDLAAGGESQQSECAVDDQDQRESNDYQKKKAALQQFIKRKTKKVETYIDPEERVEQSKMSAIAEAQIGVPLRRDSQREEQTKESGRCCRGESENSVA